MSPDSFVLRLGDAQRRASGLRQVLLPLIPERRLQSEDERDLLSVSGKHLSTKLEPELTTLEATPVPKPSTVRHEVEQDSVVYNDIHAALLLVSEPLASSYAQVKRDLQDVSRSSWAGSAHEIREVLSQMLRMLAPDESVEHQDWYVQDEGTRGPTQKQRARYILGQRNAGSREQETAKHAVDTEDRIADLVRAIYSRSSDAAHRSKDQVEVSRIVTYFDAVARDLLNV